MTRKYPRELDNTRANIKGEVSFSFFFLGEGVFYIPVFSVKQAKHTLQISLCCSIKKKILSRFLLASELSTLRENNNFIIRKLYSFFTSIRHLLIITIVKTFLLFNRAIRIHRQKERQCSTETVFIYKFLGYISSFNISLILSSR